MKNHYSWNRCRCLEKREPNANRYHIRILLNCWTIPYIRIIERPYSHWILFFLAIRNRYILTGGIFWPGINISSIQYQWFPWIICQHYSQYSMMPLSISDPPHLRNSQIPHETHYRRQITRYRSLQNFPIFIRTNINHPLHHSNANISHSI